MAIMNVDEVNVVFVKKIKSTFLFRSGIGNNIISNEI